jgi:penicillin-insensitive murein endopeptidase
MAINPLMVLRLAGALTVATICPSFADDGPASGRFGAVSAPAVGAPSVHGSHARGCLAGAVAIPELGPGWQTMRPSRNRAWGHPRAAAFVASLGEEARRIGWPRLLIGDVSQPRGGPMPSGHSSHQIGLDIDVWLKRPPAEPLDDRAREDLAFVSVVRADRRGVTDAFTPDHAALLRAAAEHPDVARIFVNAAIKDALCRGAGPGDRDWLGRIRPWWGHDAHFHVRLACPAGSAGCVDQDPPPPGDGCDSSLAWWFSDEALNPPKPATPPKPRPPLTLADLPGACAEVLAAP